MSDTPRTDEVWASMHGSGYQMMLLAQKLERELAEAKRELGTMRLKDMSRVYNNTPIPKNIEPENHSEPTGGGSERNR